MGQLRPCFTRALLLLGLLSNNGLGCRSSESDGCGRLKDGGTIDVAAMYHNAKTETERRSVCILAIDRGVIARGVEVVVVDRIFGTSFAKTIPAKGAEIETGAVYFAEQPKATGDGAAVQVPYVGWCFAFKYDSDGKIQDYYMTTAGKPGFRP